MAAGQEKESLFQSLRKESAAEWLWVMLCSLAVSSLSSNPPGVTLECLKLLNAFLNGTSLPREEGRGAQSDLCSHLVKQGLQKLLLLLIRNTTVKGRAVCCLNFSDLHLLAVHKVLSFVFKSTGEMRSIKGAIVGPSECPILVVVYTQVLCYAIGKVIFSSK